MVVHQYIYEQFSENLHPPTFVSLDLGLRQCRKHFHGQLYFQAIILEDSCFDNAEQSIGNNNDVITNHAGAKIAEGGWYDNLVRGLLIFFCVPEKVLLIAS